MAKRDRAPRQDRGYKTRTAPRHGVVVEDVDGTTAVIRSHQPLTADEREAVAAFVRALQLGDTDAEVTLPDKLRGVPATQLDEATVWLTRDQVHAMDQRELRQHGLRRRNEAGTVDWVRLVAWVGIVTLLVLVWLGIIQLADLIIH